MNRKANYAQCTPQDWTRLEIHEYVPKNGGVLALAPIVTARPKNRLVTEGTQMDSRQELRKNVLITGASGAIGRASAAQFKAHGHSVFGIDVTPYAEGVELDGFLQCDLAQILASPSEEFDVLLSEVFRWSRGSGLDVLVNNAATQVLGRIEDIQLNTLRSSLDVNLLAPFVLIKSLLPQLEHSGGSVVNVSSIHAHLTKPGFVAYAATKAALSGMTRAMAVELGSRIRINAIEPASVLTPMLMSSFDTDPLAFSKLVDCHPQGLIATPEDIAQVIYALALGCLRSLNGACIDASGGVASRLHDPI